MKRKTSVTSIVGFALSAVAAGLFLGIAGWLLSGRNIPGDEAALQSLSEVAHSPTGRWLNPIARVVSMAGNFQVLVPLGVVLLYLAWRGALPWRLFWLYVVVCLGCGGLSLAAKYLINRPRPDMVPLLDDAPFASFPSGHILHALVVYVYLAALVRQRLPQAHGVQKVSLAVAVVLPILCGVSRVYLGTHYPSDVVAGYLMGIPLSVATWHSVHAACALEANDEGICRLVEEP